MLKNFLVFKTITCFILPYILLYGLYIQINGEVSPGGGFQAGVIFASTLIGFDLITKAKLIALFPLNSLLFLATLGVVIYAGTGAISLIANENYLNYYCLVKDKRFSQAIGIFTVEVGVGLTVAAVMSMIYCLLQKNNQD